MASKQVPRSHRKFRNAPASRNRPGHGGIGRSLPRSRPGAADARAAPLRAAVTKERTVSTITTKDGVEIFYKDWGKGQPILFSHGWPLSADDWDAQMLFF